MQEVDYIIEIFPEEANDEGLTSSPEESNYEYLRSAKIRSKIQNYGTGIDRLGLSFYEETYKSGRNIHKGSRVIIRNILFYEGGNKLHVHSYFCKGCN